jgi:hypothetical protein
MVVALFLSLSAGAESFAVSVEKTTEYLPRANGKQIARVGDRWLVVTPDSHSAATIAEVPQRNAQQPLTEFFRKTAFASFNGQGLFKSRVSCVTPPGLVADSTGRVHVVWDDGEFVRYARAQAKADFLDRAAWAGLEGKGSTPVLAGATPGDFVVTDKGDIWIAAVKSDEDRSSTLCLARYTDKWETEDLAEGIGFHPPVLHLLADGSAHIAWSDTRGRILYLRHRPGQKQEPLVVCPGGYGANGRYPAIIDNGKQLIIAYESIYAQIEYAVLENGQWRQNQRLTSLDPRLATDVLHSPQLSLDRHGVIWLIFSDTTRKFTYFTRWLGSGWSDIYDARGIHYRSPRFETNLLPADWLAVEKYPPAGATEIGIALANSLAADKREFHRLSVPAPTVVPGAETLFFDQLETAQLENVELVLNEAQKDSRNPLLKQGEPGSFDQDRVFNHGSVVFDGDKFRMWYAGVHRQKGVSWWEWLRIGYAESDDGIAWRKVPTGVAGTDRPSDLNRIPALPWPCVVYKDPHESDPQRRFKVVQFDRHQRQLMASHRGEYDMASTVVPGKLLQSADGIHWTEEPATIKFPDGKMWEYVVQSFFIDPAEPDPARRWKTYGYATLVARRRAGCYAYSPDGRNWTAYPRNPILDATVSEVPMVPAGPQSQIHDTVVFPYRGYYLALFHAQHDQNFLDVELAVSRDGANFAHVKPGRKVIALGAEGTWDWQQILQTVPVEAHDKLWLYYGGQAPPPELYAARKFNNEAIIGAAGLATLRPDGFTHLALKPEQTSGSITTVPMQVVDSRPLRIILNAACSPNAKITVEVLDATSGQPLSGYARDDAKPCQEDSLRALARWSSGDTLCLSPGQKIALRFWLEGGTVSPKLYSFRFAGE